MKSYIQSESEYRQVMEQIETYLKKATQLGGFQNLSDLEKAELRRLAQVAEFYEDAVPLMPVKQPQTLQEMIAFKMFERKMNQKDMAHLLGIPPSRLSEILNGKRKVGIELAKRLHEVLQIDPAFILRTA